MEKELFLDLARNYTSLTIEETLAIDELQQEYPYSQVIHCLATRGAQDHQLENSRALLGLSAVYCTDRGVLKSIMTAPRKERDAVAIEEVIQIDGVSEELVVNDEPAVVEHEITADEDLPAIPDVPGLSGDALNKEIMIDLNRLQQLKQEFEESFIEFMKVNQPGAKRPIPPARIHPEVSAPKKEAPKVQPEVPAPKKEPPQKPLFRPRPAADPLPQPTGEALIDEIANSRKRVAPETEKQKEQIDIIDRFISKQPRIQRPTQSGAAMEDLAENSTELAESMVSETLVEILLRQGKKEKAVDMLRKLIWKFPQKKAIFAAQIDELKK